MNETELLKEIFDKAHKGDYNIPELPENISREVVEKNVLYIELQNLIRYNGSQERIEEIKAVLYPPEEGDEDYAIKEIE